MSEFQQKKFDNIGHWSHWPPNVAWPSFFSHLRPRRLRHDGTPDREVRQTREAGPDARTLGASVGPRRPHPHLRLLRVQRHQAGQSLGLAVVSLRDSL